MERALLTCCAQGNLCDDPPPQGDPVTIDLCLTMPFLQVLFESLSFPDSLVLSQDKNWVARLQVWVGYKDTQSHCEKSLSGGNAATRPSQQGLTMPQGLKKKKDLWTLPTHPAQALQSSFTGHSLCAPFPSDFVPLSCT